jgi:hypothetical protein
VRDDLSQSCARAGFCLCLVTTDRAYQNRYRAFASVHGEALPPKVEVQAGTPRSASEPLPAAPSVPIRVRQLSG